MSISSNSLSLPSILCRGGARLGPSLWLYVLVCEILLHPYPFTSVIEYHCMPSLQVHISFQSSLSVPGRCCCGPGAADLPSECLRVPFLYFQGFVELARTKARRQFILGSAAPFGRW